MNLAMKLTALLLAFQSLARAITVEIFTDPQCTISVGNSSVYTGYAGICNTATTPDTGLSIGIDLCTPTSVTMSVYRYSEPGVNEIWGDYFFCTTPDAADTTFSLTLGACTPVSPCSECPLQYFRLLDVQCSPPAPVYVLQQDRSLQTQNTAQLFACNDQQLNPIQGRFQSRELVTGVCNQRTIDVAPDNVRSNAGNVCGFNNNFCRRYNLNALSILPTPGTIGFTYNFFTGDFCNESAVMIFNNIPVEGSTSTTCRIQNNFNDGPNQPTARHGIRVYAPIPYTTVFSSTPTPSQTPSQSPTPSTPPSPAPSVSAEKAALIGVGVTAFILIAGLACALGYVLLKLKALKPNPPQVSEWGVKTPRALELPVSVQNPSAMQPPPPPPPPPPGFVGAFHEHRV